MSVVFSKTELAYIQGSREFTKEQARVLRYRINKKLKNQAKAEPDNQNQQLEHALAVFGGSVIPLIKGVEVLLWTTAGQGIEALRARISILVTYYSPKSLLPLYYYYNPST
jgi:hypothetical protein